jgi:hypothetical protein
MADIVQVMIVGVVLVLTVKYGIPYVVEKSNEAFAKVVKK